MSVLGFPRFQNSGLVLFGFELFVDHLFRSWNLRKLIVEIVEMNLPQFGSAVETVLQIEGRLREFEFYDGRYWDLVIAVIDKTRWTAERQRLHSWAASQARDLSKEDIPLDPDLFCTRLQQIMSEMKGGQQRAPQMQDTLVDDLGLDSLDLLQLADILLSIAPNVLDEAAFSRRSTVGDWYRLYLQALQMPPTGGV